MRYVKRQKLKEKMREEEEKKLFGEPDIDATSNPNGIVANDKNILDDNEKVKGEQNTMHGKNDDLKDADAPMQDVYHHDDHDIECNDAVIYEDDDMWKWSDKDQVDFRELERIDVNDCNATKRVKEARINGTPVVLVGHVGWANFAKRWLRQREVVGKKETGNTPLAAASADSAVETRTTPTNGDTKQSCKCDDSGIIHQGDKCVTPDLANTAESPVTQENATVEMVDAGTVDNEIEVKKDELKTTHQGGARLEGGSNAPVVAKGDESQTTDVDKISACDAVLKQKEDKPSSTIEEENQEIATVEMADAGTVDNTIEEKKDELNTTHQGVAGFEGESNAPAVAKVDESKSADIGKTSAGDAAQTPKDHEPNSIIEKENTSTKGDSNELLNLSGETYELDVEKMIQDIGDEDVPVIKRNYNEEKPIHGRIPASKFLTNCWPNSDNSNNTQQNGAAKNQKTPPKLYLHQWQFPLSDTAGRKLCHQNNPLPKEIMGEDLLKYWIDLPQCKLDSPLQYIFMGREDTLSKLHRDPGGLDISIAPIVGHKECVLVHRSDGSNCLYHLTASLDDIDLHRFPLMSQARIWRSVIKPGEILLMPQGTYHQCRNLTPCLSYSRFHLDTVNLLPFVQSLVNGDAPEIDHDDVLWNLTSELIKKVDTVFDETQSRVKKGLATKDLVTDGVIDTVNTLRTLRHFVREVARREEVRQVVKGSSTSNATKPKGQVLDKGVTKTTIATKQNSEDHNFTMLVDDLDMVCLLFLLCHLCLGPQLDYP